MLHVTSMSHDHASRTTIIHHHAGFSDQPTIHKIVMEHLGSSMGWARGHKKSAIADSSAFHAMYYCHMNTSGLAHTYGLMVDSLQPTDREGTSLGLHHTQHMDIIQKGQEAALYSHPGVALKNSKNSSSWQGIQ